MVIEAIGLTKRYGDEAALDGLTFSFEGKGVHGILGPVGAGKSTLCALIGGAILPTEGQILWDGEALRVDEGSLCARKKKIGYMPTDLTPYGDMTLRELLYFVGDAKGVDGEKLFRQSMEALRLCGLEDYADCLVDTLNPSRAKRLGLAVSLIGNPEVLLLDEPTAGVGVADTAELRELIRMLGTKKQVLLFSSYPEEISALCVDFLLLSRGKQVASESMEGLAAKLNRTETRLLTLRGSQTEPEALREKIRSLEGVLSCDRKGTAPNGGVVFRLESKPAYDRDKQIERVLAEAGATLVSCERVELTLADVFCALTEPREKKQAPQKRSSNPFRKIGRKENDR